MKKNLKIGLIILAVLVAIGLACLILYKPENIVDDGTVAQKTCNNNGECEPSLGEGYNCDADCYCGDDYCSPNEEDIESCPADCGIGNNNAGTDDNTTESCTEGETKDYTCSDGTTKVPNWCECINNQWACFSNPEDECGFCDCSAIEYDPVCGTDGVTYDNECESDCAEVSIAHNGVC